MIPPDHSVEAEGPRDICANLAQIFQGYAVYSRAEMAQSYPHPYHFGEWAARLRLAVRQLDAEQSPPEGPWGIVGTPDAPGICYVTDSPLIARLGPLIEAEAIAVRDALNRLGAVSPTAPPAEQDAPQ